MPFGRFHRLMRRGAKWSARHRFDEAAAAFRAASDLKPKDARVRLQLALALSAAGRYGEAADTLEAARDLDPQSAVLPLFLARVHLDHDRPDLARNAVEASLELDPANHLAMNYAVLCRWDRGSRRDAETILSGLNPMQSLSFEARLLARVEEAFEGLPGGFPGDSSCYYEILQDPSGGCPLFRRWRAARSRRRAAGLLARAARMTKQGDHEAALYALDRAFQLGTEDPGLHAERARVQKKVIKAWQKELKKEEGNDALRFKLGCLCWEAGDPGESRLHLERWLREGDGKGAGSGDREEALRLLCQAALNGADPERAAAYLKALLEEGPEDTYPHYLAGRCRLVEKDHRAAVQAFERFLDKEPSFARFRLRELVRIGAAVRGA